MNLKKKSLLELWNRRMYDINLYMKPQGPTFTKILI